MNIFHTGDPGALLTAAAGLEALNVLTEEHLVERSAEMDHDVIA